MIKLLWVDLEMTGLDVTKERIIEVAAIVTDENYNNLDTYESVVHQDSRFIEAMDDWNTNQHGQSGLTAKIPTAPKADKVESDLCDFVKKHFSEPAILAGNSIGQDRKFIDAYMPKLADLLHYRMLDVTSWKIVMENQYNQFFQKKDSHRALSDIEESIAELKFYTSFVKKP